MNWSVAKGTVVGNGAVVVVIGGDVGVSIWNVSGIGVEGVVGAFDKLHFKIRKIDKMKKDKNNAKTNFMLLINLRISR